MPTGQSPYQRVVAEIQRRITEGELAVGERVPSTRAIVRDWGVAMATASKALATLRQQGWVQPMPGHGTVVSDRGRRARTAQRTGEPALSRERVVRAGIALADAEGRGAVSLRRLAAELGVGTMSLYRYVPDKEELLRLMADTAFGAESLPDPGPDGWRAKLECLARLQWRAYRRHPWMALTLLNSLVHPPVVVSGLRHVDWALRSLGESGMDERGKMLVVLTMNGYVGGLAVSHALEVEQEQDTGQSGPERLQKNAALLEQTLYSGALPAFARVSERLTEPLNLDEVFEFGLRRQLDGIAAVVDD